MSKQRSDSDFLEVLQNKTLGTRAVAEALDMTRRGAAIRLDKLAEKELVKKEKTGGNLTWKITEEGINSIENL